MNCNSSKGKCLDEFTRKKVSILAKTVKNLIFMDFCTIHSLKGKDKHLFFFCIKIMSKDLRFCPDRYKISFLLGKSASLMIYDHFLKKKA